MTKENITERVRGGGVPTAPKININIPKVGSGGSGGRNNPSTTTKTPIRKISPQQFDNRSARVTTNTPSGGSLKAGSFGISPAGQQQAKLNRAEFKAKADAVKSSENKPVVSSTTRQGKERTPAQMAAAKRIASGKTIADVKKANTDAMRARASAKFADFKARREANRIKNKPQSNSGGNSETMAASYKPDMDAYDIVLEYLMSTEQAATIEEANYVMMQLDEENIQEIVGKVAKVIMKTPLVKLVPAAAATVVGTKMIASKMGQKSGENEIKNSTPVPVSDKKKGNFLTNFINKKRNEKGGGNYRVDEVEKKANVKPGFAGEKIKF